ncbi:histone-lysine N-methyltransferase EZA1 [Artemisia annua]|uniref:Histone-lysine N-methyltransferase EZA1 n=1 Tax=Artemisia annua TaxID=35608 RepID=A0A2U1KK93_ARTAN|nr:histone-lysine N-methyltransferase EZA1 [Artemisia annua]
MQEAFTDSVWYVPDGSFRDRHCRQCLLFNCGRHIIRRPVITPAEQPSSSTNDHEEPQSSVWQKNKAKRQKLSGKSVARRPTSRGSTNKNQPDKQYTPCDCKSGCGKDCPCLRSSNCCEKYCGCQKSCRNRYKGCHCTKSQCRGQNCPCRVARRECDPDVCRNCWVR